MKSGVEVSARRYRYTGKERDDETGLYLMGARYYACWLARWTAADPAGTVDGTNLYAYVRGSPVGLVDPSGTEAKSLLEQTAEDNQFDAVTGEYRGDARAREEQRLQQGIDAIFDEYAAPGPHDSAKGWGEAEPDEASPTPQPKQFAYPQFPEGSKNWAVPQVKTFEDKGSAAENALEWGGGYIYNWGAAIVSLGLAMLEGADTEVVDKLKAAGLSSVDIQAIRDVGMLQSAQLSAALQGGAQGLQALVADAQRAQLALRELSPVLIAGAPVRPKAVSLPSWGKVAVDMVHIAERHMTGGPFTEGRTIFTGMNERGVTAAIRQAYQTATKVGVQGDRVLLSGVTKTGMKVEMWFNKATKLIETAYPVVGR